MAGKTFRGAARIAGGRATRSARIWQRGKAGQGCEEDRIESLGARDPPLEGRVKAKPYGTRLPSRRFGSTRPRLPYGNTDMDATDGHYGEPAHVVPVNMNLQRCVGTGQLPLAGAILCCTALPHEQRVGRPYCPHVQVTNM
jgi:hypothetical protein